MLLQLLLLIVAVYFILVGSLELGILTMIVFVISLSFKKEKPPTPAPSGGGPRVIEVEDTIPHVPAVVRFRPDQPVPWIPFHIFWNVGKFFDGIIRTIKRWGKLK